MHLLSKAWILFFRISKQGPFFTAMEEDKTRGLAFGEVFIFTEVGRVGFKFVL